MAEEQRIGKVIPIELEDEMRRSYIDYAMSVIVDRALPDVRDGLKPVQRRILYVMNELNLRPDRPHKKSAAVVGEVMGKYHPHGDAPIYEAMVRMAQDFSYRYPLVDGHGNYGSVDGDPPAAMRYTEARLSAIAMEMLRDIDKQTVDFVPNYDGTQQQPVVLPARIPNLLINGASGIAVGMATNVPPHNLGEIVDALVLLIDRPDASDEELLAVVKGPDFPTGGIIMGVQGIRDAYLTGRGHIRVRARLSTEPMGGGRVRIVVTELPYMVNKATLIAKIADLVRERRIEGITEVRDESDREGLRIAIELRRDAQPQVIINRLLKHTQLEDTYGVIMLALVDGTPQVLTLRQALRHYLDFQVEVVTRRTRFDLERARERLHIVEGLRIALDHIDAIIELIRSSPDEATARRGLMERFGLTERQATAILEMQLRRLTGLEREKLDREHAELTQTIARLTAILGDVGEVYRIIKEELLEIRQRFADPRRTEIQEEASEVSEDDLVALEDVVITLTHNGYIKRQPTSTYRSQRRGGRGISAMATRDEDFVEHLFIATTHTRVLLFTDMGRMYHLKGREIPEASRGARGTSIYNLLPMSAAESVAAAIAVTSFDDGRYLFMATRNGIVKKTPLSEFATNRQGIIACHLDADDRLVGVRLTEGEHEILLVTRDGQAVRFAEEDVRPMGRASRGVIGIRLEPGDRVVAMDAARQGADVLIVTEQGYGKRTPVEEYRLTRRGGKGVRAIGHSDRNGPVVGMRVVEEDDEVMVISVRGIMIRLGVSGVSRQGRTARGVVLMRLDEGDAVAALAQIAAARNGDEEPN
ncbi:DNA gyrase subunit A [Geochorda subterranea]|uniref:DNA gyrase subunit A n=1 Tax=Geochorda subterranea TaxID=3109564 RepID=A0ABZ1BPK8_9FIRM|nr:DNA gyrase subunit A [Limnochorda sp. LNt]WRP14639.1 DNA gyrase subunit A [Limnochorda sp. LNt]